ncbi:MAG: hypothetical protein LBV33_01765 [Lachnospiraceae bacterium]|jgi:hypothetical protein|nr:hypothetical protein [Lachnospiraceae bacterium]
MLIVILSWLYIGVICLSIGIGVFNLVERLLKRSFKRNEFHYIVAGLVTITVYVQYFSLIGSIGYVAHLLMLILAALGAWFNRQALIVGLKRHLRKEFFWEGLFYVGIVILFAFFTSRGEFHTDTGIYHGQAIRWYEEYGVVKGLGNLQLHYAYNSSYLAFASIFSMFAILGTSLHTTTGFMEILLCIYACHGLIGFWQRKNRCADFCRIAIMIYLISIIVRSMSPATDYGTMMMAFYLLLRWVEIWKEGGGQSIGDKNYDYGLLAVLAVFVMTMKLSAATLLLLAILPAWYLVKGKEWHRIVVYILLGVVILLPFLVRNVIISGWLVYPFAAIDWFTVDWKIPKEYLAVDVAQITVWGRNLFDIGKIDMPLREWVPIWWQAHERYDRMMLTAVVGAVILGGGQVLWRLVRRREDSAAFVVLYLNLLAGLLVWFFMAPFIRYGLVFILLLPAVAMGELLSYDHKGAGAIAVGMMTAWIYIAFSPFVYNYITVAGVFAKQNVSAPYYLMPQDYDQPATKVLMMGTTAFYVPLDSEYLSYYDFPGSCYGFMVERSEMRGETIADGFRAK